MSNITANINIQRPTVVENVPFDQKREFFIRAMQNKCFYSKVWLLSLFTVFKKRPFDPGVTEPYTLVINQEDPDALYYVNPDDTHNLIKLEGSLSTEPLLRIDERITLMPFDLENVPVKVDTTYGRVVINAIVLIWAFGSKIPFINTVWSGGAIDKLVVSKLVDYPPDYDPSNEDPNVIYVHELKKYMTAMASLSAFAPALVPAASEKLLVIDPSILKLRDELIAKNQNSLQDAAVMAGIIKELVEALKKIYKYDSARGFIVKGKTIEISLMKKSIMYGLEYGFDKTGNKPVVITKALTEGVDLTEMPAMVDGLRAGSYDRGHQTALAGAGVKEIYRALQNAYVVKEDCGTRLGKPIIVTPYNWTGLNNRYAFNPKDGAMVLLNKQILQANFGKRVYVRSPQTCKIKPPGFCAFCIGPDYSMSPNGIHLAVADVLGIFMNDKMKSMHGKALQTARYSFKTALT